MIETIIYKLSHMVNLILCSLLVATAVEFVFLRIIRKDKLETKDIKNYGLFMNLNNIEILILCISICKMITMIYGIFEMTENYIIYIMIFILSAIILLYDIKNLIKQGINCIAPIIILYMIYILNNYQIEVENNMYIFAIKIVLMVFMAVYAIQIFLTDLEDITNKSIRRISNEKK